MPRYPPLSRVQYVLVLVLYIHFWFAGERGFPLLLLSKKYRHLSQGKKGSRYLRLGRITSVGLPRGRAATKGKGKNHVNQGKRVTTYDATELVLPPTRMPDSSGVRRVILLQ